MTLKIKQTLASVLLLSFSLSAVAQVTQDMVEASRKTEVWEPVPPKVETLPGNPPSDAVVLLSGDSLDAWESGNGEAAKWDVNAYAMTVKPGAGDIQTKQEFCDVQLHLEFNPAIENDKTDQAKANSGVFLQGRYEVQILDNYTNKTYANGQVGAVYKQHIPLANPSRPAGEWQYYDIIFTAPKFDGEALKSPAYVTVLLNGVLVQNHVEIQGTTEWIGAPSYKAHGCAPIKLQDHGSPNRFRNIWVREL
ncbi:3-keto-disaccharide hydrolase [Glaciecola sp. 1036]|uniref:3-keto-disaccharide hydrolase n=1 Tax=Alteromonadaceae TaxID=72275 RepID=UPI003D05945D